MPFPSSASTLIFLACNTFTMAMTDLRPTPYPTLSAQRLVAEAQSAAPGHQPTAGLAPFGATATATTVANEAAGNALLAALAGQGRVVVDIAQTARAQTIGSIKAAGEAVAWIDPEALAELMNLNFRTGQIASGSLTIQFKIDGENYYIDATACEGHFGSRQQRDPHDPNNSTQFGSDCWAENNPAGYSHPFTNVPGFVPTDQNQNPDPSTVTFGDVGHRLTNNLLVHRMSARDELYPMAFIAKREDVSMCPPFFLSFHC